MNSERDGRTGGRSLWRSIGMRSAILALATVSLGLGTACDEEAALAAFRSTATDSIQSGVNSIMDGVIDGMFAVLEVGTDESTTDTETDTTTE